MSAQLQRNPTWLAVVAAAIVRADGMVLMQRRPEGKNHGGLWEFPGGKVESGEIPRFALVREIEEELALVLDPDDLRPAGFADGTGEGTGSGIVILLYTAPTWRGEPEAREGGAWDWFTLEEIAGLAKPPLDDLLLEQFARAG